MRRERMSTKENRKRRRFTDAYKPEVVRQCQLPGKRIAGVAKELDPTRSAVMC
jgi:transposase-like protein